MSAQQILVVDDEPKMRRVLEIMLRQLGHSVVCADNGRAALEQLRAAGADLIITDMRMPEMDGIELLTALRSQGVRTPVIMITAHSSVENAVDAMKRGAADYLQRPFDVEALEIAIARVIAAEELARENAYLRREMNRGLEDFIGDSPKMAEVYALIRQVAPTRTSVMISGETGTGKELAARAIHRASPRRDKLFVPINCAAIPADILESELFGYEKGAFTGALRERVGKFELADGGTLFLDEITEMPVALQAKLLRVVQECSIERLGSNRVIPLDLRIIAATNSDPREAVRSGKLRQDLFFRLNVFNVRLPPLAQRLEDIPVLVEHFIAKHAARANPAPGITARALERLRQYAWPGNVRELENMVERALILANQGMLDVGHFPLEGEPAPGAVESAEPEPGPLEAAVEALEMRMIAAALARTGNNKARAAALLEISERALWYKLKKYESQ